MWEFGGERTCATFYFSLYSTLFVVRRVGESPPQLQRNLSWELPCGKYLSKAKGSFNSLVWVSSPLCILHSCKTALTLKVILRGIPTFMLKKNIKLTSSWAVFVLNPILRSSPHSRITGLASRNRKWFCLQKAEIENPNSTALTRGSLDLPNQYI